MFLLHKDIQEITDYLQRSAHLDEELLARCQEPMEEEKYDDAVRIAFLVLEKRLRQAAGIDQGTGRELANRVFGNDSMLLKEVNLDAGMASALRELYAGAFGVFRNPVAHQLDAGYGAVECREIVTLVDLLLRQISKAQSPEAQLKKLLKHRKVSATVQSWLGSILAGVDAQNVIVGDKMIGLHSSERSFGQIDPRKQSLAIRCFTRGEPLVGTKVASVKYAPRWGTFSVKNQNQANQAIEILKQSRARLNSAIEAGEPTAYFAGGAKQGSSKKNSMIDVETV